MMAAIASSIRDGSRPLTRAWIETSGGSVPGGGSAVARSRGRGLKRVAFAVGLRDELSPAHAGVD